MTSIQFPPCCITALRAVFILFTSVLISACGESSSTKTAAVNTSAGQESSSISNEALPAAFIPQRADPQIYRTDSGHYYFIATAPKFDRIQLRSAGSLRGLASADEKTIWEKHESGPMSDSIWAPELHRFNNTWYIYFAAGEQGVGGSIRMYVLANEAADPMQGEWKELGRVSTARDSFSLDATVFEHKGQRYLVWAQRDPEGTMNSALYLATLDSPTQVGAVEVEITRPTLDWEIQGYKVNEGAAVIIRNGKIFISYSASATDHRYAVGLVWADVEADLLDKAAWHKSPEPIFFTNEALKRFGPGHNSFTLDDDGKTDVLVYHARDYAELQGTPLTDPNRHTYIRRLHWTSEGFPDFGQHRTDSE
ncbi:alpha-N-arabinofuranosidase [Cellvibrio mixtus]|uniref:Alpha-N-arabinofuranosidase n=1 Tax=Cellvibrio mixtus TaxID=39650 RepID=A0A266Q9I8_9GAMM|nr:glycoside hydrolase family 43 protein [Cellvibrio mixtus]OZY86528.1 alpha-N-arabinofuranosidase [Cellvibrio mixtus]